jgi:hypothetical protein
MNRKGAKGLKPFGEANAQPTQRTKGIKRRLKDEAGVESKLDVHLGCEGGHDIYRALAST